MTPGDDTDRRPPSVDATDPVSASPRASAAPSDDLIIWARLRYEVLGFNDRECAIANLLVGGLTTPSVIAEHLGISQQTVNNLLHGMYDKAQVQNRLQLVIRLLARH
jgi:DNA-binding CsgD family transcriptional regulator